MEPYLERIGEFAQSAIKRLTVRSALNPMLWLTGISTPMLVSAAVLFRDVPTLMTLFAIASLVPMCVTCAGFIGFAWAKPEKLQSEDYQLRHESLQIIQQKGGRINVEQASLTSIANPESRALGSGEAR